MMDIVFHQTTCNSPSTYQELSSYHWEAKSAKRVLLRTSILTDVHTLFPPHKISLGFGIASRLALFQLFLPKMAISLEPTGLNIVAATLGAFLCIYGTLSYLIKERLFLGEAPLALIVGIALEQFQVIPRQWIGEPGSADDPLSSFSFGFSRMVLGVQVSG